MPNPIELTGQTFSKLTVLYKVGDKGPGIVWRCRCECGNEVDVQGYRLTQGQKKSCGCSRYHKTAEDLTGRRFNHLTVISRFHENSKTHARWLCRCDCGNETVVTSDHLKSGNTTSCGCAGYSNLCNNETHGMSGTKIYKVWRNMIQRCENPNTESYKNYGGRGISVCKEWRDDFTAFYNWAVSSGYDPDAPFGKCTIDRIDVNGNYEPSNCRWVDMVVQRHNQRIPCRSDM